MVAIIQFHTSHPTCPATEPLSLRRLRKGGRYDHYQSTFDNKKILIKTILASNLYAFTIEVASGMRLKNLVPEPRRTEDKEQVHLDPEQLTLIAQRQWKMPQAQGDSMPQRIAKHRFGERPNRHHSQWMETAVLLCTENIQNHRMLNIRDHKQFYLVMSRSGPVTGIRVFKSAGNSVIEVQVPSQQEIPSLGCVIQIPDV